MKNCHFLSRSHRGRYRTPWNQHEARETDSAFHRSTMLPHFSILPFSAESFAGQVHHSFTHVDAHLSLLTTPHYPAWWLSAQADTIGLENGRAEPPPIGFFTRTPPSSRRTRQVSASLLLCLMASSHSLLVLTVMIYSASLRRCCPWSTGHHSAEQSSELLSCIWPSLECL